MPRPEITTVCLCVFRCQPRRQHTHLWKWSGTSYVEIHQNCSTSQCSLMMWYLKAGGSCETPDFHSDED